MVKMMMMDESVIVSSVICLLLFWRKSTLSPLKWYWKESKQSMEVKHWCWWSWKKLSYDLILMQFTTQWSWKEMVLKEVAVYKIVDNFDNNGWIWLKFWNNVDAYKGHLWYELQLPANLIMGVIMNCVCF